MTNGIAAIIISRNKNRNIQALQSDELLQCLLYNVKFPLITKE